MNPQTGRSGAVARGLLAAAVSVSLTGCHSVLRPELHPSSEVPVAPEDLPILKAHMASGELYVLDSWRLVDDEQRLEGSGTLYSLERERVSQGPVSIDVTEVALFETNQPDTVSSAGTAFMGLMTTVTGALSVYCLANPNGSGAPSGRSTRRARSRPTCRSSRSRRRGMDL